MFAKCKGIPLVATAFLLLPATAKIHAQTIPWPYDFKPVRIVAGGYVPGLIAHPTQPELFYARTDIGGVYRFGPGDSQWTPLLDAHSPSQYNLNGPESIALDPTDSNRLYIAAGTYAYPSCCAMLVSTDRGHTFQTYPVPFEMGANNDGRAAGERLAVNPFKPAELFMGTRFNGLWVSEDNAQTWKQMASFPVQSSTDGYGVHWVVFDPKTSGTIYVGSYTTAKVYVSTDDGATWSAVPGQPTGWPASYSAPATTAPPAPERALIGADGDLYVNFDDLPGPNSINYGLVEKYNPSAKTWTDITPPIDAPYQSGPRGGFVGLTQDPNRPGLVAVSTMDRWYPVDTVYVTQDGGSTWANLGLMTAMSGTDGNPHGNYYFDQSVFSSISPYLTFGDTSSPNTPNPTARFGWWMSALLMDPSNPNLLAYGTGATIYATENLSAAASGTAPKWAVAGEGIEETAVTALISPKEGAHLISGVGDIGGFVHTDFSVSPKTGMFTNPVATTTGSLDWAGQKPALIVRTASPSTTSTSPCNYGASSSDGGTTWAPFAACAPRVSSNGNGGTVSVDASGTTVMWTPGGGTGAVQFSTDGGKTWLAASGLPSGVIAYADKKTPEVFYAYGNGNFYRATVDVVHGTAAFTQVSSGLPASEGCYGSGCGVVDVDWNKAGTLWLPLGSNGLYDSTDGGSTWTQLSNVSYGNSAAVGAPSLLTQQDAVFLYGQADSGAMAVYRSDDSGRSWVRVNDDAHQYGGPTLIQADPRVWGRVYLGMNGRGIIYGSFSYLPDLP